MDLGDIDNRLLIFGGPYSNLGATRAMRAKAESLGFAPAQVICTGDLVAYCGEPRETVDLIRDWGCNLVMGNCEESLGFERLDCGCGFDPDSACSLLSIDWYRYASEAMSPELRAWMRKLPRMINLRLGQSSVRVIHGSVTRINQFIFSSSPDPLKRAQIDEAGTDIVIGGHAGIPFGQLLDDRFWLNAGVIGMPANDATPDGWYMLLEARPGAIDVSWHRLSYDARSSSQSTRKAGMLAYADALIDGLWPNMDVLPEAQRHQRGKRLELRAMRIKPRL